MICTFDDTTFSLVIFSAIPPTADPLLDSNILTLFPHLRIWLILVQVLLLENYSLNMNESILVLELVHSQYGLQGNFDGYFGCGLETSLNVVQFEYVVGTGQQGAFKT
ncbi:unnamed protein product [Vicia faba]|uniref:Uncharacterized protein n=1 Tax=Vicia faba TaxID=3906 RepID=A0AAV0YME3_VICFA|nr:unnamed protein product [Vicia faba]